MSRLKFFDEADESLPKFHNSPGEKGEDIENVVSPSEVDARYRCEQFNTTKVEDNISFHCNTKKQYYLQLNSNNKAKVKLEQFIYKINPEVLKEAISATELLEYDKENVSMSLNEDKTIRDILNFEEIQHKWNEFKPQLIETSFYKSLLQHNIQAAEDFLKGGDMEFGSEENLLKTYDKSFFFHTLFNDYNPWVNREKKQTLKFTSQIFVNIPIELELTHGIVEENDQMAEIRTVGKLIQEKLNNNVLEEQYNKFYKPMIEYNFTEYNYQYVIRRILDKKTGLIVSAKANLLEEVKYNYQFITQFDLKKID